MNAVVHEAINRQINAELTASYSYLQMSAFCARQSFNGCAHWLRLQSQDGEAHIFHHAVDDAGLDHPHDLDAGRHG